MLVSDNIKQLDNIWAPTKVLKYFYLPFYLLFLNRFEDLDYATLVAININAFKNLTVFSPSNFPNDLVVILITPLNSERFVIPVIFRAKNVDVGVDSSFGHESDVGGRDLGKLELELGLGGINDGCDDLVVWDGRR